VSDQELRRTLMELRRELAKVGDVDADMEEMLSGIRADIDVVMDRAAAHTLAERLTERLSDAVERFEATHPRLATAMGAVIDQLANIGV
jgi:glucose-6-phosphate isomerase